MLALLHSQNRLLLLCMCQAILFEYELILLEMLVEHERRASSRRVRPAALVRAQMPTPRSWALRRVSRERNDATFEQLFRVDTATFEKLLTDARFAYYWRLQPSIRRLAADESAFVASPNDWPRDTLGRAIVPRNAARIAEPDYVLQIVLIHLSTTGELHEHACLSGLLPSTLSMLHRAGMFVLKRCLREWSSARIVMPTNEAECHALALRAKVFSPAFEKCIGFLDGHMLHLERSSDATVQTLNYSGYKKGDFKKALWLMLTDGTIGWAAWDFPGSFNDANIAHSENLGEVLDRLPPGYWVASDAAFSFTKRVMKRLPESTIDSLSPADQVIARTLNLHFKRIASENGIAQLVNPFRRLGATWLAIDDQSGRRALFECCARLNNVRAREMHVGQIATMTDRGIGAVEQRHAAAE